MKRKTNTGLYLRGKTYWMSFTWKGKHYKKSTGTANLKIAQQVIETIKAEITLNRYVPDSETEPEPEPKQEFTFAELWDKYSPWLDGRQKASDRKKRYISQLEQFKPLLLSDIDTARLEQFQSDRLKKGNRPATANRLIAMIKHMYTKAVDWKMVDSETTEAVKKVKMLEENNKRLRYLSVDECIRLINACDKNLKHLRPIVQFALNTGCRRGEILNLEWSQVDLKHGFILLGDTKNGERREIPINDNLKAVLQGVTRRLDVPYVFYDPFNGKPYGDIKHAFQKACKNAGITDFRFHDLRHTFASHLVMAGVDITSVSKLLGHKSLTMTLRYSHLAPAHLHNAVNKLRFVTNIEQSAEFKKMGYGN